MDWLLYPSEWVLCILAALLWLCFSYILVILSYNTLFHPLVRYPGPLVARILSFRGLHRSHHGATHRDILRCHAKYGEPHR